MTQKPQKREKYKVKPCSHNDLIKLETLIFFKLLQKFMLELQCPHLFTVFLVPWMYLNIYAVTLF